jgi:hypothetical protein
MVRARHDDDEKEVNVTESSDKLRAASRCESGPGRPLSPR